MKPFLKWAGNKYPLVERIKATLPKGKRLIEPFVGAGAVFLNTDYPYYLLAEANPDLINLYRCLQTEGQHFIDYCQSFFDAEYNTADAFYQCRSLFNTTDDMRLKSALFVYLNKHCFNGLCRYNAKGGFNTPFGQYSKPYFPQEEMLFFHAKLQGVELQIADFVVTMESAELGDVVYCDPPYVPLSNTANFTSYNVGGFNQQQQLKLAQLAEQLAGKGIPVLISNHNVEFTQQAYQNATLQTFDVKRHISCKGSKRDKAAELLAMFGGGN